MIDEQETKCILATLIALRDKTKEAEIDKSVIATTRKENEDNVLPNHDENTITIPQPKRRSMVPLPDSIIRDEILSYRPFRSFRVVLIRGDDETTSIDPFRKQQSEYSLTFGSNRGPVRFNIVEMPYLPAHSNTINRHRTTYRAADGVIISCYMSRFFEFCDRYGYNYASTSIFQDVTLRRASIATATDDNDISVQNNDNHDDEDDKRPTKRQKIKQQQKELSIVLCGNNVDVSHVDARLSSIVFKVPISRKEAVEAETIESASSSSVATAVATAKIEAPRHPFSSLARSLTNDNGLEFHDISTSAAASPAKNVYMESTMTEPSSGSAISYQGLKYPRSNDDDPRNWNWLRAQVSS